MLKRFFASGMLIVAIAATPALAPAAAAGGQDDASTVEIDEWLAADLNAALAIGVSRIEDTTNTPRQSPFGLDLTAQPTFAFTGVETLTLAIPGTSFPAIIDPALFDGINVLSAGTLEYNESAVFMGMTIIRTTESTECGDDEYRERALFVRRNGLDQVTTGGAPLDPGIGSTEAVAESCRGGVGDTFFGLNQGGAMGRFQQSYPIFTFDFGGSSHAAFLTNDPTATVWPVVSGADTLGDPDTLWFQRGADRGFAPETPLTLSDVRSLGATDDIAMILEGIGKVTLAPPVSPPPPATPAPTNTPAPSETPTDSPAPTDAPTATGTPGSGTPTEPAPGTDPPTASPAPAGPGGGIGAGVIIVGVLIAGVLVFIAIRVRSKDDEADASQQPPSSPTADDEYEPPFMGGSVSPMAQARSDRDSLRNLGEAFGLPSFDEWQQIPFGEAGDYLGTSDRPGTTGGKRYESISRERIETNVRFAGVPPGYEADSDRFAFWINDTGELKVGTPTDPHALDDQVVVDWGGPPGSEIPIEELGSGKPDEIDPAVRQADPPEDGENGDGAHPGTAPTVPYVADVHRRAGLPESDDGWFAPTTAGAREGMADWEARNWPDGSEASPVRDPLKGEGAHLWSRVFFNSHTGQIVVPADPLWDGLFERFQGEWKLSDDSKTETIEIEDLGGPIS